MVKNPDILLKFELDYEASINHSVIEKLEMFENMLALKNKVMGTCDPLEGLDEKILLIKRFKDAARRII